MYYSVYRDAASQWRRRLVAENGRTIADSAEGYHNKADCYAGIALVRGSSNVPV
jgi:uncharacterized protein